MSRSLPITCLVRIVVWLAVVCCLVLFVVLRMRGVDHLLMWDEAQDVMAVRTLADGSGDAFTPRLWVHPPALPALSLLVRPLAPGFAERYAMLALGINACAMVVLFLLNRRIFGATTALWSCFFLAVMPGAVFYDVWIKGGPVVSLATLGAIGALMTGKPLLSGLCLGFALLDKETALLPCIAVGILALLDPRHRHPKSIGGLVATTLLTSGWWYLFMSTTFLLWLRFAVGAQRDPTSDIPWHSLMVWWCGDLGIAGTVTMAAGIAWMAIRRNREVTDDAVRPYAWWPLLVTVVTYGGFSLCRNKSPWFTMFVYPSLATVQAVGLTQTIRACTTRYPRLRHVLLAGVTTCAVFMCCRAAVQRHGDQTQRVMPGSWARATRTRAIVDAVNARIAPGDRLLATTLSFYGSSLYGSISPIFVYYLTNVPRHMVPCSSSFDRCADSILAHQLDWALLVPEPGAAAAAITNGFKTRFNLDPIILDNGTAFLYRTSAVSGEH